MQPSHPDPSREAVLVILVKICPLWAWPGWPLSYQWVFLWAAPSVTGLRILLLCLPRCLAPSDRFVWGYFYFCDFYSSFTKQVVYETSLPGTEWKSSQLICFKGIFFFLDWSAASALCFDGQGRDVLLESLVPKGQISDSKTEQECFMLWTFEDRKCARALGLFPDLWTSAEDQFCSGSHSSLKGLSQSVRWSLGWTTWSLLKILLFRCYCSRRLNRCLRLRKNILPFTWE